MWRSPSTLIATGGAIALLALLPATALASGPKPAVEGESAANVTATDATLEARIDPGSGEDGFALETTYEFFLESPWCGIDGPGYCEASGGVLVYKGVLPEGSAPQVVSVDLASVGQALSPGTTYGYSVVASNQVGKAYGTEKTFATSPAGPSPCVEDPQDCVPSPSPCVEDPQDCVPPPSPCVEDPQDCQPAGPTIERGPVSNEPEVPLGGGQQTTWGTSATLSGSAPTGVQARRSGPKPMAKHRKHRKHGHHRTKAARRRA